MRGTTSSVFAGKWTIGGAVEGIASALSIITGPPGAGDGEGEPLGAPEAFDNGLGDGLADGLGDALGEALGDGEEEGEPDELGAGRLNRSAQPKPPLMAGQTNPLVASASA